MLQILLVVIVIVIAPIILHYSLFTWSAHGVNGDWLSFFGNYLGLIGAFTVAIMQFSKQKQREDQRDRETNRSYIVAHYFTGPLNLKGIKTHENSRIISTPLYEKRLELNKLKSNASNFNCLFYKFSHYGSLDIILNCNFIIEIKTNDLDKTHVIEGYVGIVEKGIEIYIPIIVESESIFIQSIKVEYNTLKGERILYSYDATTMIESHAIVCKDKPNRVITRDSTISSDWYYPNKFN